MNGDASVGGMAGRPGRSPRAAAEVLATCALDVTLGRTLAAPLFVPGLNGFGATEGGDSGCVTHQATVHYGIPKEAVANLLRLPKALGANGDFVLRFSYFCEERRSLPICLGDYSLPPSATGTRGGLAILSMAGTRLAVLADEARTLERVRVFLDERLALYQLVPDANGQHDWVVTTDIGAPVAHLRETSVAPGGGEVATTGWE